jgi:hypothetical protein
LSLVEVATLREVWAWLILVPSTNFTSCLNWLKLKSVTKLIELLLWIEVSWADKLKKGDLLTVAVSLTMWTELPELIRVLKAPLIIWPLANSKVFAWVWAIVVHFLLVLSIQSLIWLLLIAEGFWDKSSITSNFSLIGLTMACPSTLTAAIAALIIDSGLITLIGSASIWLLMYLLPIFCLSLTSSVVILVAALDCWLATSLLTSAVCFKILGLASLDFSTTGCCFWKI